MAISVINCGDSSKMRKKDGIGTGNTQLENLTVTGTTTVADPVNGTDAINKNALEKSLENVVFGTDVEEVTDVDPAALTEAAFYVTLTNADGSLNADKTYEEVKAAYDSNLAVYCKYVGGSDNANEHYIMPLNSMNATDNSFWFSIEDNNKNIKAALSNLGSWLVDVTSMVPTYRKVNGLELATDITLTASDIGALSADTIIPTKISDLTNDAGYLTQEQVSAEMFIVTISRTSASTSADKTYDEIKAAYDANRSVVCYYARKVLALSDIDINSKTLLFTSPTSAPSIYTVTYRNSAWSVGNSDLLTPNRKINGYALRQDITLSASDVGAATVSSYTFTIGTSWNGSSAPYTQTIPVSGILATDDPIVDLVASTTNYEKEIEAYAKVFKITTAAGKLTVFATEKTTTALTCKLKVVR